MGLLDYSNKENTLTEVFRGIRTNIEYANIDTDKKVIMVTSSKMGEGKSTIITNLAISFAQLEQKKILVVDCDLRRPTLHRIFKVSNSDGLTDILLTNKEMDECIKKVNDIDLITSGDTPKNPSEILASKKMENFLYKIKDNYDYIFIDTPPISVVTDAEVLSSLCDGAILVIGYNEVDRSKVELSKSKLEHLKVPILGAVINKAPQKSEKYGYYDVDEKRKLFKLKK